MMKTVLTRLLTCTAVAMAWQPICSIADAEVPPSTLPATQPILEPRNDLPGLPNFSQVSSGLYRGAQPTAEGFRELRRMGIRTVISLRALHSDRADLEGTGLRYVRISCNAWHPEDEDVLKFLKLMRDPANHPVFVHCQHGADRTGMMVAVYRIVEQGWTIDEAMAELPRFGFHPIWTQIRAYLVRFDADAMHGQLEAPEAPRVDTVN